MTKKEKSVLVADELPDEQATAAATEAPPPASTLIEFPGSGRLPPWRKELSERVREIQQRRAREAALEAEAAARRGGVQPPQQTAAAAAQNSAQSHHQLGLVPQPETPEVNPIVAAALRRLERARAQRDAPVARESAPTLAPRPVAPPKRETKAAQARATNVRQRPPDEAHASVKTSPPRTSQPKAAGEAVTKSAETTHQSQKTVELEETVKTQEAVKTVEAAKTEETVNAEAARAKSLSSVPATQPDAPAKDEVALSDAQPAELVKTRAVEAPASEKVEQSATAASTFDTFAAEQAAALTAALEVTETETPVDGEAFAAKLRGGKAVIDDSWLTRLEADILPKAQTAQRTPDDTAPVLPRVAGSLIDLLLVAFLSSPFAAIIELTSGNWSDPRVAASMGGVVIVVMFLYLTGSTALAGRTWGMSLFSLQTVDAETALAPSVGQSARRAIFYILSLATAGLGIIYSLFDAEHRTAHDHLSGTVVVRE